MCQISLLAIEFLCLLAASVVKVIRPELEVEVETDLSWQGSEDNQWSVITSLGISTTTTTSLSCASPLSSLLSSNQSLQVNKSSIT